MEDAENTSAAELAVRIGGAQDEQVAATEEAAVSPAGAEATREERLLAGKYKTVEDLESSYLELQRNYTASRQNARVATPAQQPAASAQVETLFDNETIHGIRAVSRDVLEQEKAAEFGRRHREELADPLLRGAVRIEIEEANARGEYMDQETALANAKAALEARLAPKVEKASKESFEEGRDLTRRKEQAGAIGSVSASSPATDPDTLSAEEYAAYHGIPYA